MLKRLSIIIIVLSLSACGSGQTEKPQEVAKLVRSEVAKDPKQSDTRTYPATIAANEIVDLAFQVSGALIEFPVAKGQAVKQGQLLARLDPRDYELDLEREKAKLIRTYSDYERFKVLVKKDAVSKAQFDDKKAQFGVARAQYGMAKKALDDTYLRAPFSGVVALTYVENFQNIEAKEKILSLQDVEHIEVIINVPETDVFFSSEDIKIKKGEYGPVVGSVAFESYPGKSYPVRLKEFATEADPVTLTYKIVFIMKNPEEFNIFPGMSATFTPDIEYTAKNLIKVPASAAFSDEYGQYYVWVIEPQTNTVKRQEVTVKEMAGDLIQIESGLEPNQRIVTSGVHFLEEGEEVRLMDNK